VSAPTGNQTANRLVVLATGGTGGHLFPAAALAEALSQRGVALALFTDRRKVALPDALSAIHTERLPGTSMAGKSFGGRLLAMTELARGTWQAGRLLRRLRPAAAVGFGGYASVPTMLAAQRAGIPTVLHEQNAVLGRANRVLVRRAKAICTSFEIVEGLAAAIGGRTTRTGNPVRAAIAALRDQPYPTPIPGGPLSILVTGGSQGARIFSDVMPQAMALLTNQERSRVRLAQQCRAEAIEATAAAYDRLGMMAELTPFFGDIPQRVAEAQLVIARAGASSVAELTAAGRPAILVPYPYATDDHQTVNAEAIASSGGAWLMPQEGFTGPALAQRIRHLLDNPALLAEAAHCAHALGVPDAAERLAGVVEQYLPMSNGGAGEHLEAAQ
jgi:UDP-N-acetylglucosamine--N-acetylmuramyl-(pentapeptide) pyrophosphoryl-undecaprenol N-acetylglucosamine transferase